MITIIASIYIGLSFLCALTLWAACAVGGRAEQASQHLSSESEQQA